MQPIKFPEQNKVFAENQPEYNPLPAYVDAGSEGVVISCWELDEEEKKQIAETGRIYLGMLTFHQPLQPIRSSILNPFPMDNGDISQKLLKDENHDHYWIEEEVLYESYKTIRGLRFRRLLSVPGMPDSELCTEEMLVYIEKEYL